MISTGRYPGPSPRRRFTSYRLGLNRRQLVYPPVRRFRLPAGRSLYRYRDDIGDHRLVVRNVSPVTEDELQGMLARTQG